MKNQLLRKLPKMDLLIENNEVKDLIKEFNREQVISSLRDSIDFYRTEILEEKIIKEPTISDILKVTKDKLILKKETSLKTVINCTGIVIHTNLGRSLLSKGAIKAMNKVAASYNNLEYNLEEGKRGSRHSHISEILKDLTGAEDAVVVNNNAAAVMLVLSELAKDKEVIVSRGELVEIGGSFRVPEIMEMSGSYLKEVGTTNRTHLIDYERAINENTSLMLKVHSSNFKIIGFTKEVTTKELAEIGKRYNITTMEDLGSGMLVDLSSYGFNGEKTVVDTIKNGIDIVTFSGDKLLGGPQAGIIVGKKIYIDRIKKNPLMRALRIDKVTLAALEATLMEYLDKENAIKEIPTLNMISLKQDELKVKAENLLLKLKMLGGNFEFTLDKDYSFVGGGSMPEEEIDSYVIKINSKIFKVNEIEKYLRSYKTPIITRISKDKVILDVRTIATDENEIIFNALKEMLDKR